MSAAALNISAIRRVAIVRCCGLGDVAQMTPLLRQIRADAPEVKIEVFINSNVACLLDASPWTDVVHAVPSEDFLSGKQNPLMWRLWHRVKSCGPYDVLLYLDLAWLKSLLARRVAARRRVGFRTEAVKPWQPWDMSVTIPTDYPRNADHTSLWFLRLWQAATGAQDRGFSADLSQLKSRDEPPLRQHIALVPKAGNAITPGAVKQWPARYWPALAEGFLAAGWVPVVMGQAGDLDMASMPAGTLDMQGKHRIPEAAAYLSRCAGVVANDSGLYHLAMAMGVPAVGLFGPTAVARTGPFRASHGVALSAPLPCVPCCATICAVPAAGRPEPERPFCLSALQPAYVCQQALSHFARFET